MFDVLTALFHYRDKRSPDKLGLYPLTVHTKALPERRYLWATRILVIFSAVNISFTVILSCSLYLLIPQKTSLPILLQSREEGFANLMPQQIAASPESLQNEGFIREYVNLRHALPQNYIELNKMWQEGEKFWAYSSNEVWQNFYSSIDFKDLRKKMRKGYRRNIDIYDITRLSRNLYSVDFSTITRIEGTNKSARTRWKAYLTIAYETYSPSNPPKWYNINPYGFKVTAYSLNYQGKPQKLKSDFSSSFSWLQ